MELLRGAHLVFLHYPACSVTISCSEVCVVETHLSDFIGTSAIITPFTKSTAEEDKESKVHVMCVSPDILSFVKMKPRWLKQTIGSV